MNIFFGHENVKHPESIFELGELKPTVKSDFVGMLRTVSST